MDSPENYWKIDEPVEYKEKSQDEAGNTVDPNSYSLDVSSIDVLRKEVPEITTVTPRYSMDGEYITLDGIVKHQLSLATLSERASSKKWRRTNNPGTGEIMLLSLGKTFSQDINSLICW